MDLDRDLFRITYEEGQKCDPAVVLKAIQELNYTPSIACGSDFQAKTVESDVRGAIPSIVQGLLDRAKTEQKLVMIKLTADW